MSAKNYVVIVVLLALGAAAGSFVRGYSDGQGWTTAS